MPAGGRVARPSGRLSTPERGAPQSLADFREVSRAAFGGDLDVSVDRDAVLRDGDLSNDLDAGRATASDFRLLMEIYRAIRLRPNQWRTSVERVWKRMSQTPATFSVRSK